MTNILLCGACGKMGHAVAHAASENPDINIAAGYDTFEGSTDFPIYSDPFDVTEKIDAIIDFSHPLMTDKIIDYAKATHTPAVICTTGLSADQTSRIEYESKFVPIFVSANMSLGINLIIDLVCRAAKILESNFDIEILEKHHNQKLDAPSGTALAIADAISAAVSYAPEYTYDRHSVRQKRGKNEIGIHSVRGGTIVGEHTVIFAGNDETIEFTHKAASKEVFAVGALRAAEFIKDKESGLYAMKDLISAQQA